NHTSACPGPLLMGSGSSIQRGAKYKQGTSENALAEELHAQGQVVRSGPTSYRHRRMPKSGAGSMGVVCSQEANPLREEMSPTAMPQHWRKKWERPAATFLVNHVLRRLPPLSAPGRSLPRVPPERLAGRSAVARMAVDYWRNEAVRDAPCSTASSLAHDQPRQQHWCNKRNA
ncbi:Uncharacterized protein SCF082_LOCUS33058, partial [Durusdinium trenchii]